jgi:hypothetical protein
MMLLGVVPIARADTFTYELNGSLMDSGGPSLVSQGGTLGSTGYAFGVNEGLSLPGTRAFDVYSIDIRFYFNDVNASLDGYQRILDFKNRTSDSGLYSLSGQLVLFSASGCWFLFGPGGRLVQLTRSMARLPILSRLSTT